MQLVFATHNQNKLEEVKKLMPSHIHLVSLLEIGCTEDIPEIGKTLEENAQIKANYVTENYQLPCFADDTGLLVNALNGAPGVYSARYAGAGKHAQDNMNKLLKELASSTDRSAYFKTIIALNLHNETHLFEGIAEGEITFETAGVDGFGYDPIFKPIGYKETFAQLSLKTKNSISHRGKAIQKLMDHLKKPSNV